MNARLRGPRVLVTCEHASHAVPADLEGLGLAAPVRRRLLQSHAGWDPGALPVARALGRALGVPVHQGRWSRLVADLNRSEDHPRVVARRALGVRIPANQLDRAGRAARLQRCWRPYRAAVEEAAADLVRGGGCVHLSIHSFVEELGGVRRDNDIGLLYDPDRPRERALVDALKAALEADGLSVRRNFPYFGSTDGFTSHLRALHPAARYQGIEVELNQRLSRTAAGQRRLGRAVCTAVLSLVGR